MTETRTLPELTPLNRAFWTAGIDGELRVQRCGRCGIWSHPPRLWCVRCGSDDVLTFEAVSGRGTLYTFTVVHHPFVAERHVPYAIALVELVEQAGLRVLSNIVNCNVTNLAIGMPLTVTFELHHGLAVPLFEPEARTDYPDDQKETE